MSWIDLIEKLGTKHYGHDTDSDQGQNTLSIIGFAVRDAEPVQWAA